MFYRRKNYVTVPAIVRFTVYVSQTRCSACVPGGGGGIGRMRAARSNYCVQI